MFPCPGALTVASVLLNVITFTLGYLTWVSFRSLDGMRRAKGRPDLPFSDPGRPLTRSAVARALKLTLAMGVIALLLEVHRLTAIARHFDTTWVDLVTHPELFRIRLVAFIQENLFRTSGVVMLLSVTSSLFSIGFVLLGVFLHLDRTRSKYLYLGAFLAISLTIGLIHLSRCEATSNILYLVFAYCFTRREFEVSSEESLKFQAASFKWEELRPDPSLHTSHLKLVFPIAAIVLLFAVIDILLHKSSEYDQPNRLQGWLFHFYWYLASPLAAFNEFVTTFAGDLQWGQNTFFPLYKWLCRLHLAQEVEVTLYGNKVLIPYMTNVYTYLRNFYEDFGILGVAIVPYLLGWATATIRVQAQRCLHWLNLYLVLLLFIFFSFYNYLLMSNQIYLQVFFGFVLFRYRLPRCSESGGSPAGGS